MSSIMKFYREYAEEARTGESRYYLQKETGSEFLGREEIMLKGENRRTIYSQERVCLNNDRKR